MASLLGAGLWVVVQAAPATAEEAPPAESIDPFTSHAIFNVETPPAQPATQELRESETAPSPGHKKATLLRYRKPLKLGDNDLVLDFRAPGKKKSIVSMEFKF